MNAYINEAKDEREQHRRFRVFLACYLLGLIPTGKQTAADDDNNGSTRSNTPSLLQRLKGLYNRRGSDTQNVDNKQELPPREEAAEALDDRPEPVEKQPG